MKEKRPYGYGGGSIRGGVLFAFVFRLYQLKHEEEEGQTGGVAGT